MLIRELAAALGWNAMLPFDADRHAERYRAQPKERRRVVNALYRAGGTLALDLLLAQTGSTPEAVGALEEAGLVWRRAKDVVLPLEHLFATPLLENSVDTLVESLKIFPKEALWAVAASCGVDVDGADEIVLRARLYRYATSRSKIEVSEEQMKVLRRLEGKGWADGYQDLERWLGRSWVTSRCSVENLLAEATKPLRELLLKLLVVPERLNPGSPTFARLTVPRELRASIVPSKSKRSGCSEAGSAALRSIDGRLRGDLLRYLLMVEQDPPTITQRGGVNLRDLNRLAKRAGMEPKLVEILNAEACDFRLVKIREDRAVIAPEAENLFSGGSGTFARKVFAARRTLWTRFGTGWSVGEDAAGKISDMVTELLQRDRSGVLCAHCLEGELRERKDFRKFFRNEQERNHVAHAALQGHARLFFKAGMLAVEIGEREEVKRLKWTPAGIEAARDVAPLAPEVPRTLVQPTGEIIAPGELALSDLRAIGVWADVKSVDAVAVFALTRASALRAAQRGEDPAAFRAFLERLSGGALPQSVAFHLDELASRMGEVELIPCSALIRVKHPHLLEGLEGVERLGDALALVPPGRKAEDILDQLRKQGLLIARTKAATDSSKRKDLEVLLRQAGEAGDTVDLVLHGGRTHEVFVDSVRDGVLKGEEAETFRRLSISLDSILEAHVSEIDAEL